MTGVQFTPSVEISIVNISPTELDGVIMDWNAPVSMDRVVVGAIVVVTFVVLLSAMLTELALRNVEVSSCANAVGKNN